MSATRAEPTHGRRHSNLRTEGMATEDGQWLSGRSVPRGPMLHPHGTGAMRPERHVGDARGSYLRGSLPERHSDILRVWVLSRGYFAGLGPRPGLRTRRSMPMTGTEDYYRERAPEYDQVYRKLERQEDLRAIRAWLPDILRGRRVLDVASGTGYWTDGFADDAASVLVTDVNDSPLEVARNRREWPTHVQFAVADAFDLGRVPGDFDAAFVGFFWSHIPLDRLENFLRGLFGRLDDEAVVVFMDNRYVEGSNHPIVRTDDQGNTFQRRTLASGAEWEVLKNFPSMESLGSILEQYAPRVVVRGWDYYWAATCSSR